MSITKSSSTGHTFRPAHLAAVVAGLLSASISHGATLLEEVMVTAQKREQNAQEIPIAISAFSGDQMQSLGIISAEDLADYVPGMQVTMTYANTPSFTIRGMNANDFAFATSPAVAVYLDGIYKASQVNSGAQLFDIERVEVLKGPQGTLWGKNTTGGAVSVTSVRPEQDSSGYVTVGYGNDNKMIAEGAVGGGLSDNVSGRISMQYVEADGPYDNVTFSTTGIVPGSIPLPNALDGSPPPKQVSSFTGPDKDPSAIETMALRGQLLWEPSDEFQALVIGHYASDKSKSPPIVSRLEDPDVYDENVSVDFVAVGNNEFYGLTADIRWDVGPGKLVSISGWDAFDRRDHGTDLSNTTLEALVIPAASPFLEAVYFQEFEQFSQELRYEVESDNVFWLGGLYYSEAEFDQSGDNTVLGIFGTYFEGQYRQLDESLAGFGHVEWTVSDVWQINGGLRYSDESRKRKIQQTYIETGFADFYQSPNLDFPTTLIVDSNGGSIGGPNPFPNNFDTSEYSYRIGVDWTPTEDMLVYYSLSRGLKSGGFDSAIVTTMANLAPIDDEQVIANEVGIKWDPTDSLRFNAAAFYYDYTDMQQRVSFNDPILGSVILLTNINQVDVAGLELELLWSPIEGLEVLASASALDTKINDGSAVSAVTGKSLDGNEIGNAPEVAASLLAKYEFDVSNGLRASLQASVNYTGDHYVSIENFSFNEQDYTLVGARAAIGDSAEDWELSVYGENLTNEIYVNGTAFAQLDYWISRPRSYGVRLDYRF